MKKIYISPETKAMEFLAENMLAMSVVTTSEEADGSGAWSNEKIWDNENENEWKSESIWDN